MGHIRGQSRDQATLFPERLDDLIPADHPVRVVDAFVDSLDLAALEFAKVEAAATGRPPYHPGDLVKLYVYGYLNQIRSSRQLERESARNVELLWLLNRLSPDFKTIADFRKDHRGAIVGVCRALTRFCQAEGLLGGERVAIDGSKFQAVASVKAAYTPKRLERELARLDARIQGYLQGLDEADTAESGGGGGGGGGPGETEAALSKLRERRGELQALAEQLRTEGRAQQVTSEPEARLMRRRGGGSMVSYNVQTAVDARHKLIVTHAVTDEGNDHRQLYPMARAAQGALGAETLTVVADVGYHNGAHGADCEGAGITAVVPAPRVVNPRGPGFDKSQFVYEPEQDQYRCPAGQALRVYKTDHKLQVRYYSTAACERCALRAPCTRAKRRSISRSFYAESAQAMDRRAREQPELMRERACLSEHPFGTLKRMMGNGRFLMRGLDGARAEMALNVLGYNLKRAIAILGVPTLRARLAT